MHKWHVCVDATTEEKLRIVAPKLTKLRAKAQLKTSAPPVGVPQFASGLRGGESQRHRRAAVMSGPLSAAAARGGDRRAALEVGHEARNRRGLANRASRARGVHPPEARL